MNNFELVEYKTGDTIVVNGTKGEYLYVLDTGKVEFWAKKYGNQDIRIATLRASGNSINTVQGRIFGEQSLQYDRPRAATVIATKPTKVWRLKKDDFMETSKYTKIPAPHRSQHPVNWMPDPPWHPIQAPASKHP